jgi:proteasome lid subunit RPN8/RPN11
VNIPAAVLDAVLLHCREVYPDEACGVVYGWAERPGDVHGVLRMHNVADHPRFRYEFDPHHQVLIWKRLDSLKQRPRIIYHSHTTTGAELSPTDVRYANDPDILHLVVGTVPEEVVDVTAPVERRTGLDIRLWRVEQGAATEVPYTIVERVEDPA